MRIVVFGPQRRVGAWEGERIVDLNAALAGMLRDGRARGRPETEADRRLPSSLAGFIARGAAGLDDAGAAVEYASRPDIEGGIVVSRSAVRLHAPAVDRPRIACAAGNYAEHTLGSARRMGVAASAALAGLVGPGTMPSADEVVEKTRERGVPRGFWKDFAMPRGPDGDIPYPDRCELFDYEGEVVVVLGRSAKDVPAGRGGDYVWGVSLLNDWSIRGRSTRDSLSFNLSKNFDGAASVGPSILVGQVDPADIVVETRVNGELRQRYRSGDMIFSHAQYVEYLSRDFVLLPGDMISGGSGPGSATDASKGAGEALSDAERAALYLQVGDVVEVSAEGIGTLRNRVVAKDRGDDDAGPDAGGRA